MIKIQEIIKARFLTMDNGDPSLARTFHILSNDDNDQAENGCIGLG